MNGQFARKPLRSGRKKRCRVCREWFRAPNTLARACSPKCALELVQMDAQKAQRAKDRATREQLKTASDYRKEAQAAFNSWIRLRDVDQPCISCGDYSPNDSRGGAWDCGHYRSTGANPELRFEPLNAAKQCKKCNQHLSGNVVNFRIGLRNRIGDEDLAWVEGAHKAKHYSKDDLREIRDHYRREARRLKKEREQKGE